MFLLCYAFMFKKRILADGLLSDFLISLKRKKKDISIRLKNEDDSNSYLHMNVICLKATPTLKKQ